MKNNSGIGIYLNSNMGYVYIGIGMPVLYEINNNTILNNGLEAIYLTKVTRINIINNTIVNGSTGIYVDSSYDVRFSNNILKNLDINMFLSDYQNIFLGSNKFENIISQGLVSYSGSIVSAGGNVFSNIKCDGVYLVDTYSVFRGNILKILMVLVLLLFQIIILKKVNCGIIHLKILILKI